MTESNGQSVECEGEPSPKIWARARRLWLLKLAVLSLVIVLLFPFLGPTVERIRAGLDYPYQMDSEEGFVLYQAWRLKHGKPIFRKLDQPPYVAATYAPVYLGMSAATLWGEKPSFFGGRLIAALSVIAICMFMGLIVWRETRCPLAVVLAPLLFLNSYDVYQWLPYYRVDFTALAFGMAGLWLLSPWNEIRRWRLRAVCACFIAMVYTKQVEVAPFVAATIYFAFADRAIAWRLLRNVAAWGIGIAALLTLTTRGQFLVHNVYYNANPFSWWQFKTVMTGHFYFFNRFFAVAAVISLVWFFLERLRPQSEWVHDENSGDAEPRDNEQDRSPQGVVSCFCRFLDGDESNPWGRTGLYAAYAIVASIGILGLGKIGAATNYLIEPKAACSLFIAVVLGKTIRPSMKTGRFLGLRPVFFPVAFVLLLHGFEFVCRSTLVPATGDMVRRNPDGPIAQYLTRPSVQAYLAPQVFSARDNLNPTKADRVNGVRVVQLLSTVEEPTFCEHAIFQLLAGQDVYIQPFIMKELAIEKKWDQTPVVEDLAAGQFPLIVTTEDVFQDGFKFHYTDEMTSAIRTAYRPREVLFGTRERPAVFAHYIYEPRPQRADAPD